MKEITEKLAEFGLVRESFVVVLTGAGVSAESGIPTFRGEDGLWKQYRAGELATPEAFSRDPATVWEWYDYRRQIVSRKEPNAAHLAITRLDEAFPRFLLITQNIDGLHRRAGTKRLVELHGNLFRVRCTEEGEARENLDVPLREIPPKCRCGALLRPDVVWFGEALPEAALAEAFQTSRTCNLMLVIGTSAVVQPAATIPLMAKHAGAHLIEINTDPTPITPFADLHLRGKAAETLPAVAEAMISVISTS